MATLIPPKRAQRVKSPVRERWAVGDDWHLARRDREQFHCGLTYFNAKTESKQIVLLDPGELCPDCFRTMTIRK